MTWIEARQLQHAAITTAIGVRINIIMNPTAFFVPDIGTIWCDGNCGDS